LWIVILYFAPGSQATRARSGSENLHRRRRRGLSAPADPAIPGAAKQKTTLDRYFRIVISWIVISGLLRAWRGTLERDVTKLLWRRKPRWIVISSGAENHAGSLFPVAQKTTLVRYLQIPGAAKQKTTLDRYFRDRYFPRRKPRWIVISAHGEGRRRKPRGIVIFFPISRIDRYFRFTGSLFSYFRRKPRWIVISISRRWIVISRGENHAGSLFPLIFFPISRIDRYFRFTGSLFSYFRRKPRWIVISI
jgi:hypothetical protein